MNRKIPPLLAKSRQNDRTNMPDREPLCRAFRLFSRVGLVQKQPASRSNLHLQSTTSRSRSGLLRKRCPNVHDWGQVCRFQGKNSRTFRAFTKHQAEISIDDFHPRNDGFIQSYKGTWKEQGMIATAWLDTVEPGHFPAGLFLPNAYELSSTYERVLGGPARGSRQEELGADLARKLSDRMKIDMKAAGWQVVAKTREGKDIWQYRPARVFPVQNVTSIQVTVTRTPRNVTFTCAICGTETTQVRMPGPRPRYCSDTCRAEGEREKTRKRVARFRQHRTG
jgi:hypothetical protein